MNTALILAGGIGSRMQMKDMPKQYLMVRGRPIIDFSLCTFQENEHIHNIIIVVAEPWRDFVDSWLKRGGITKFRGYALPGETRQFSIFNGLKAIEQNAPETHRVIIHDAARPFLPGNLIGDCLEGLYEADAVMPVLPMKDTCYKSEDGQFVDGFLPRSQLFAGQAPEAFLFRNYLRLHRELSYEQLAAISGSSELAFKCGLKVKMIKGSEMNFKVTTPEDLLLVERILDGGEL